MICRWIIGLAIRESATRKTLQKLRKKPICMQQRQQQLEASLHDQWCHREVTGEEDNILDLHFPVTNAAQVHSRFNIRLVQQGFTFNLHSRASFFNFYFMNVYLHFTFNLPSTYIHFTLAYLQFTFTFLVKIFLHSAYLQLTFNLPLAYKHKF